MNTVFSHNDVINHLLNLFNRMNKFEEDLHYVPVCTDGPDQIMHAAERMFPDHALIILMSDWHSSTMPDRMSFIDKWIDMLELLSSNNAKISVSLLFTNMWNLRSAYLQATSAMSIGKYMHPLDTEYHYSKYYIYDILDSYHQKLPLTDIYVQYLDKLSSEKAAGRSDLILLYNYLCSERNISLTAKKSYMHRNSIIYRLQKIQDELELNLDDDDVRLRLLISFKILEMENKIKLEEPHETHETRQSRTEKFKIPE